MDNSKIKVGSKVIITNNRNFLNTYMYDYMGEEATVTEIIDTDGSDFRVKLDIDDGYWTWDSGIKNDQISLIE